MAVKSRRLRNSSGLSTSTLVGNASRMALAGEGSNTQEVTGGLVPAVRKTYEVVIDHIRDGRFQRSMCVVAAASSFVSGLEVAYEHYKGSYSNLIMYSPVLLSGVLTVTSIGGAFSERIARGAMRSTALVTLTDGIIGFGFHIRGIHRKPGGWRLPLTNVIMGPPIFAPLLFGTAAYLAFMASYLRREEETKLTPLNFTVKQLLPPSLGGNPYKKGWQRELHVGKFQKHLIVVSLIWGVFSGVEAWYSHYKSRFRIWAQWTPVILAPIHVGSCIAGLLSERAATTVLPASSALAVIDGTVGFGYHVRGILRRPGGKKTWLYNILYGPPIFAPLLFAACGMLGLLASALRREDQREDQ